VLPLSSDVDGSLIPVKASSGRGSKDEGHKDLDASSSPSTPAYFIGKAACVGCTATPSSI